jgi:hypothetical protein
VLLAPAHLPAWHALPDEPLLRQAAPGDLVELAALKRRVERRCYAHLGTAEALSVRLHRRGTAWYLLGLLAAGDLVLLAEHDGALVGLGAARVERRDGVPQLHLHAAAVDRSGLGAGRALTRARLRAGADLGLAVVTADCLVGAFRAEARLRRLGLTEVGERTASPTFPGAGLSHWAGSLHTAMERVIRQEGTP